jgi:hypothetical protein
LKKSEKVIIKVILITAFSTVILANALDIYQSNKIVKKLQSGEVQIECSFKDGTKLIEPSKIVSFDQDTGTVIFTNGYSKSCEVVK